MAHTPIYSNVSITGAGGLAGSTGITYSTGATNATWITESYYPKKAKVQITDSDIEIDGLSLKETMLAVKKELQLPSRLNRNTQLEQEFNELEQAADRYYELERKFLEQKKMWETLKKTDQ